MVPDSLKFVADNCNTLVALAILDNQLPDDGEIVWALNRNVPCIGGDGFEFKTHHINQLWEYMRDTQHEWYQFAFGLRFFSDSRLDYGVRSLQNGCLHDYMFPPEEEVTFDTLLAAYESIVDPARYRAVCLGLEVDEAEIDEAELDEIEVDGGDDGDWTGDSNVGSTDEMIIYQMVSLWEKE
jgi:hypothetical protein